MRESSQNRIWSQHNVVGAAVSTKITLSDPDDILNHLVSMARALPSEIQGDIVPSPSNPEGKFDHWDWILWAAAQRSIDHVLGFDHLIRNGNVTCAFAIMRMQLDILIRLYGIHIAADRQKAYESFRKLTPLSKLKDSQGKRLTDSYIVGRLGQRYEWMERVYKSTSRFVHFSGKHAYAIMTPDSSDSLAFRFAIGPEVNNRGLGHYKEGIVAFAHTTDIVWDEIRNSLRQR